MDSAEVESTCKRFRYFLHCCGYRGVRDIKYLLKRSDLGIMKTLSINEVKSALRHLGVGPEISEPDIIRLFNCFLKNCDDTIDVDEFVAFINPPLSRERRFLVSATFDFLDRDRDDVITVDDIMRRYNVARHPQYLNGNWTREDTLAKFLNSFLLRRDERCDVVSRQQFMDYYTLLGADVEEDVYFDYMLRTSWNFKS